MCLTWSRWRRRRTCCATSKGARKNLKLCQVEIARASDLGVNDDRVIVRCHLGHQIRVGDHVMGYDLRTVNISGHDDQGFENNSKENMRSKNSKKKDKAGIETGNVKGENSLADQNANLNLQDVIIVKKKYLVAQNKREDRRAWKLRRIPQNTEDISDAKNKHSAAKDEREMGGTGRCGTHCPSGRAF